MTTAISFSKEKLNSMGWGKNLKGCVLRLAGRLELAHVFGRLRIGVCSIWIGWAALGAAGQDSTFVEYRYADGSVSSRGALVEGVPSGYWSSFYEDGTRKSEGNWSMGALDGEWMFYDRKGRVETTLFYRAGLKDGWEVSWDSTGAQLRALPWVRDTLNGEERVFNGSGVEVERIPWVGGKREGVALEFAVVAGAQERIITRRGYRADLLRWVEEVNRLDDQQRKTGKWMTFWPNGRIRVEGPYERNLREGVFKYFNRNGDLEKTETYKWGVLVEDAPEAVALDLRKSFHPNGEVARSGPWRDNDPMGTHRFFDEQGHLVGVRVFREGVLQASGMLDSLGRRTGDWVLYWETGERRSAGQYLDGKREGFWEFFDRDGRVEQEGTYRQGEWNGRWKWFHGNGMLHRDEVYRRGREEGAFVELTASGDTLAYGMYERGSKQGLWLEHVNDDRRVGAYLEGERDGVWRHFGPEGILRFEGEYVGGIPTGQHMTYWPNGVRASVGSYEGGLPEGNWRYFDSTGIVQLIRQYRAGRIAKVNGTKTDR